MRMKRSDLQSTIRDRKGTPKNLCDKTFAELPGELSGAICLTTLVLLGSTLEFFRQSFGALRATFFGFGVLFSALDTRRRYVGSAIVAAITKTTTETKTMRSLVFQITNRK